MVLGDNMQVNRLFEIVYILLNKNYTTAKELAEHFEVSVRTIYRDIDILCQSGIPIYTSKGKGGGIGLLDNFVLNKSVLSKMEQEGIISALQGLNATNYPDINQVLSKLNNLFGTKQNNWIEVDFSDWGESQKENFNLIKTAVIQKKGYCNLIITAPLVKKPTGRQNLFNYGSKIKPGI
ncbi:MAG: HTH domain-containing protein [Anaerocolumna sp.]